MFFIVLINRFVCCYSMCKAAWGVGLVLFHADRNGEEQTPVLPWNARKTRQALEAIALSYHNHSETHCLCHQHAYIFILGEKRTCTNGKAPNSHDAARAELKPVFRPSTTLQFCLKLQRSGSKGTEDTRKTKAIYATKHTKQTYFRYIARDGAVVEYSKFSLKNTKSKNLL